MPGVKVAFEAGRRGREMLEAAKREACCREKWSADHEFTLSSPHLSRVRTAKKPSSREWHRDAGCTHRTTCISLPSAAAVHTYEYGLIIMVYV